MTLLSFFKTKKGKENNVDIFYKTHLPKYNEYVLFMKMVKGKRLNQMFYGNTECIQFEKRGYLTDALYNAVSDGFFKITTGDESIAETLSKKDLINVCKELGLPISGNKIDLVKRVRCKTYHYFDTYKIDDWILATDKGLDVIKKYDQEFKSQYDHLQQTIYNLLLNDKQKEAIILFEMYRVSYPFKRREGFFINYNNKEIAKLIRKIRSSDVFDEIGFPKIYVNAFKTVLCISHMFGDVILEDKFEEIMPGSVEFIKRSKLIKNKDYPFMDLDNLIRGMEVYKHDI